MKKYIIGALVGVIIAALAVLLFNTSGEKSVNVEDDFFSEITSQNNALAAENAALEAKARELEMQLEAAAEATTAAERRAAEAKKKVIIQASPADHRDDLIASLGKVIEELKNQLKNSLELNHIYTIEIANRKRMFDNTQVALDLRTQQFEELMEKNKRLTEKVNLYSLVVKVTIGALVVALLISFLKK